ncbi:MAG: hypothetical protein GY841_18425 [FCB group bacterium]|nr:hypothetical protein [FCB group bacterium]
MRKTITIITAVILVWGLTTAPVVADWLSDEPHKMHHPQLPDVEGWDVKATYPVFLADDWMCSESGPVSEIHFWGSWRWDDWGTITGFHLSIHADIPDPDPEDPTTYSSPANPPLWEYYTEDFIVNTTPEWTAGVEGWYDPSTELWVDPDHENYHQINIFIPELDWFIQDEGMIYWLNISAEVPGSNEWGWKTTLDRWNDDAVWSLAPDYNWAHMDEPPSYNYIPGDVDHNGIVDINDVNWLQAFLYGGGPAPIYFPPGTTYPFYAAADVNGDCMVMMTDMSTLGSYVQTGSPVPTYCPDFPPVGFGQTLDLAFVISGPEAEPEGACCYNPTGGPDHIACIVTTATDCGQTYAGTYQGDGTTCGSVQACCLPDGSCVDADSLCCLNELGGSPMGTGTSCAGTEACCFPDGSCQDMDALCCLSLGGTPGGPGTTCAGSIEACCFPDGTCADMDPTCCLGQGGTPKGQGSVCLGDGNGNSIDDVCETPPQLKWEQPPNLDPTGMDVFCSYMFDGTVVVLADDFLCTDSGRILEVHVWASWYHDEVPPVGPEGFPITLSLHSDVPAGFDAPWSHPGDLLWMYTFQPGQYTAMPYMSGIVEGWYSPFSGIYEPVADNVCWEYIFYMPQGEEFVQLGSPTDPLIYWLDVNADLHNVQGEFIFGWKTTPLEFNWNDDAVWAPVTEPVPPLAWTEMRYPEGHMWTPESINLAFAIYGEVTDTCEEQYPGDVDNNGSIEMADIVYLVAYLYGGGPAPTVLANADVNGDCYIDEKDVEDLSSFVATGGPPLVVCTCVNPQLCDCFIADANNDATLNVGDAVYLINYVFKSGPAPVPYPLCNGDANSDCAINVGDAVYMINYVFKAGPRPPYCHQWIQPPPAGCGGPLRD